MADDGAAAPGFQINTTLLAGAAISALIGSLLIGFGALVGGTAFVVAVRRWVQGFETPPREMAKQRLVQLKRATSAGARAWREDSLPT